MKRPAGITFCGGLLTMFGGFYALLLILDIVDSLRFFGIQSIFVENTASLAGFILYGCVPIFLYSTGIGMLSGKSIARWSALYLLPFLFFMLIINHVHKLSFANADPYDVYNPNVIIFDFKLFFKFFLGYLCIVIPVQIYFRRAEIITFFDEFHEDLI